MTGEPTIIMTMLLVEALLVGEEQERETQAVSWAAAAAC